LVARHRNRLILDWAGSRVSRVLAGTAAVRSWYTGTGSFSAARARLRRWSSDELEDGLAHGGQCRSRRRPVDSFFPALVRRSLFGQFSIPETPFSYADDLVYLHHISVRPSYRRQGVGRALMDAVRSAARERGITVFAEPA
jgi:GNAT superfamily N-acetyltransferase